jgi:hypothetical protein
MRYLFSFFLGVMLIGPASAEVRFKNYERVKTAEWFKFYIHGVATGLQWANTQLDATGHPQIFCVPPKFSLNAENSVNILARKLEQANRDKAITPDTPIEMLLLDGLIETFPCK